MREADCGCRISLRDFKSIEHTERCKSRGWHAMSKEAIEADKKKLFLEDLREEAQEKVDAIRGQVDQYAVVGEMSLDVIKAVRPTLAALAEGLSGQLRGIFGHDLAPILKAIEDAGTWAVRTGATTRAEMVKELMEKTQLSESTCLAIVLSSAQAVEASIKNAFDRDRDKDTKKK